MCGDCARDLPVFIVGIVIQQIVPVAVLVLEIFFVGIRERTHFEVKVILVRRAEIEWNGAGRSLGFNAARFETDVETEISREIKRAVVISVVAIADVAHGSLRRNGLERRMGIHQAIGGIKAGVRNAPHAGAAVVARNVFHQPVDGVVSVGAFVRIGRACEMGLMHGNIHECAFGEITPADILVDEDEAFFGEKIGRPQSSGVVIDAIGRNRIWGPLHQDRILL